MKVIIDNIKHFIHIHNSPMSLENDAVIACTSDMRAPGWFDLFPDGLKLILTFDDVEDDRNINAMKISQAQEVSRFVKKCFSQKIEKLFVCCDSGESRSTAIAASIIRYYSHGKNFGFIIFPDEKRIWSNCHYHPNIHVYRLVSSAFSMKTSTFSIFIRKRTSEKALHKKINSSRNRV